MIELYMAVDSETHETFVFRGYEDLKEFAKERRYAFDYYKIGEVEELSDYELGYY